MLMAVWLATVALVPLAVWYGTRAFEAPPGDRQFARAEPRLEGRIRESEKQAGRADAAAEKAARKDQKQRPRRGRGRPGREGPCA
jgi:hypothetical protein